MKNKKLCPKLVIKGTDSFYHFLLFLLLFSITTILSGCSEEPPLTTWEDIKQLKDRTSLDGTDFDVPLNYFYGGYRTDMNNWPKASKEFREGKTRFRTDYVKIYVLIPDLESVTKEFFPDLEPVTKENLNDFIKPGWGREIIAYITHKRTFEYYFKHFASKRLDKLPESLEVPSMLHYIDNLTQKEIYLSHDHAVPELIFIRCAPPLSAPSPACEVATQFVYKSQSYYLKYTFSRKYLSNWREIDKKIRILYSNFAQ